MKGLNVVDIAVIFPSRGLAFSETCEELLKNLEGYKYEIYFAHGEELPECFNKPIQQALKKKHTHVWIVEDDMVLPEFTLTDMLKVNKPIVAYDYPVTDQGVGGVQYDSEGKALFCGTGCMLVKTDYLKKMPKPIFRTDIRWDIHVTQSGLELKKRVDSSETYGMHDVTFGLEQYRKGKPIYIMPKAIAQRKLVSLGQAGSNNGQHQVVVWDTIKRQPDFINLVTEAQKGLLVAIKLKNGKVTNVSEETAQRLEKDGKGKRVPTREIEFL